jgi:multidrug transporter EmrE-like cation transporter
MVRAYFLLALAIVFEVLWAVMLKVSKGFTVPWASVVLVLSYLASLGCLNLACRQLALSTAYPVWTGLGGTLVALIGVTVFGEPLGPARAVGVSLVILGVALVLGFHPSQAGAG